MRLRPDQVDDVLVIARAHGTIVAAQWAGVGRETVVALRKRHDGYQRGRGHPTRQEMAAMAVRDDCQCPRCRSARGVNYPALTPEQQQMVDDNRGLVGFVLRSRGLPEDRYEDAFQDGVIGLMRAAQKFDPAKGFRFSTYALNWIKAGIQKGQGHLEGRTFRAAAARRPGAPEWYAPASLDAPVGDGELTIGGLIPDDGPLTDEQAIAAAQLEDVTRQLHAIAADRIDRAIVTEILRLRDDAWADRDAEVAAAHGVTREWIRRRRRALVDLVRERCFDEERIAG